MRLRSTAIIAMLLAVSLVPFIGTLQAFGDIERPGERATAVTFTNVTAAAGLGGLGGTFFSWADYDNDSDVDLLIDGSRLMRNNLVPSGTATFTQATTLSGSGVWADFDNDGDLDTMKSRLWSNDGDGTFTDMTSTALAGFSGSWVTAAGWGDYNRDGFVDLYITRGEDWNDGNPRYFTDDLWKNNGNGTFTNVTASSGVWAVESASPKYGRSVTWGDYNNDGWPDCYVANYRLTQSYLWENQADGTFKEVAKERNVTGGGKTYGGTTYYGHSIGSAWGDIDNDGYIDLISANLAHKDNQAAPWNRGYFCDDSKVYWNKGGWDCNFTDIRAAAGIPIRAIGGTAIAQDGQSYYKDELWAGSTFGDCNNDGDLDLFVPGIYDFPWGNSFLFINDGDLTFTDIAGTAGAMVYDTYGGAWADFDNDGRLDLVTGGKSVPGGSGSIHLLQNDGPVGKYVKVNLKGTEGNGAGIGARLTAYIGGKKVVREVEGGTSSHGQQNTLTQHLGLGTAAKIDVLEVKWVSGRIQFVRDIPANATINITEGKTPLPVISSLTHSPPGAEEDATLTFTATVIPGGTAARYFWDFTGDGSFDYNSTTQTAQHAYNRSGTYRVAVRVLDNNGYAVEQAMAVNVSNVIPVAAAGADRTVDMDQQAAFDGSGSSDTPTDMLKGISFNWTFGDGATRNWSADPRANHTYTQHGVFNVMLAVRDDDGAVGRAWANITVRDVAPSVIVMADRTASEDETVQFTGSGNDSATDLPKLAYKWEFGDGNSTNYASQPAAAHAYAQRGNYTARLSVRDPDGTVTVASVNITVLNLPPQCFIGEEYQGRTVREDVAVGFDGTGTDTPSDLGQLSYRWDFGDGTTTGWSGMTGTTHGYTSKGSFNVTLTVRDGDGDTGTATTMITVTDVVPTAEITTDDQTVDEDTPVELDGKGGDSPSDENMLQYRWDFGDGNSSAWLDTPSVEHSYAAAGRYRVTLAVQDDENASAVSAPVFIEVANLAPRAVAEAGPKSVDEDATVNFTARSSTDTPSDIPSLSYHWDFGDDDEDEGMNVSHVYKGSGSYTVRLRVTDQDGAISEDASIKVKVRNVAPVAVASANRTAAKAGEAIMFSAGGFDTPSDRLRLKYSWFFGDGAKADGMNVTHVYATEGRYTVMLEVSDPEGEKGVAQLAVDVSPAKSPVPPTPAGLDYKMIGGAIGVVVAVAVVAVLVLMFQRRKKAVITPARPAPLGPQPGPPPG